MDAFDDLLRAWQDGDAGAEELDALEARLRADGELRKRLVESVILESALYGRYAKQAKPAPLRRRRVLELAAAGLLVAASALAVWKLWRIDVPTPVPRLAVRVRPAADAKDRAPLLERAPLQLAEAVERALAGGGTPVEAALEEDDGKAVYAVFVLRDGRLREVEVDARDGRVMDDEAEDEEAEAGNGPGLLEAVAAALGRQPGRALKARRRGGAVEVEVWSLGRVYEVTVEFTIKEDGR